MPTIRSNSGLIKEDKDDFNNDHFIYRYRHCTTEYLFALIFDFYRSELNEKGKADFDKEFHFDIIYDSNHWSLNDYGICGVWKSGEKTNIYCMKNGEKYAKRRYAEDIHDGYCQIVVVKNFYEIPILKNEFEFSIDTEELMNISKFTVEPRREDFEE